MMIDMLYYIIFPVKLAAVHSAALSVDTYPRRLELLFRFWGYAGRGMVPRPFTSIRSQMLTDPGGLARRSAWGLLTVAAVCLSIGPGAAQDRIDDSGYGPIAFCDSLVAVRHHFSGARDTVFHAGNESWPGRAVPDEDGAIVFITDRTDAHRIYRIRSTSSRVPAGDAVRPGQPVGRLLKRGEEIEVFLAEGEVWLLLRERGIGVMIDRESERVMQRRWIRRPNRKT